MMYHLQLQIDTLWRPFFFINDLDLNASCQVYRELRAALRLAGVQASARLKRVARNDLPTIECNHQRYPHIAAVIREFGARKQATGEWDDVGGTQCFE